MMAISEPSVNFTLDKPVRIYLDHNATTPPAPQVKTVMCAALDIVGNPSSIHAEGREARDTVENAREEVAALLRGKAAEVVFTSGGTEADWLGLLGLAKFSQARGRPARVIATAIEHPAVLGAVDRLVQNGFARVVLPVDGCGRADLDFLEGACRQGAAVVALALANHELGTVQDVARAARIAHEHGAYLHCDAVQAAGKVAVDALGLGADTLAISAHKLYGPKGVGALWVRDGVDLGPLVAGGHQERERRPGTENVPGIAGLGEAARLSREELAAGDGSDHVPAQVQALAAELEEGLMALGGVRIHGAGAPRVGNTVNAGFDGALGEAVAAALDLAGVAVSTGAACTSGSVVPSPVLLGIGLAPDRAVEAVRFSLGRQTTREEIAAVLEVLPDIVARARAFR